MTQPGVGRALGAGRALRLDLEQTLGAHAHIKIQWDDGDRLRMTVYCLTCRTASIVSHQRHEVVALWNEHEDSARHRRKVADPHPPAPAVVFAPPIGDHA